MLPHKGRARCTTVSLPPTKYGILATQKAALAPIRGLLTSDENRCLQGSCSQPGWCTLNLTSPHAQIKGYVIHCSSSAHAHVHVMLATPVCGMDTIVEDRVVLLRRDDVYKAVELHRGRYSLWLCHCLLFHLTTPFSHRMVTFDRLSFFPDAAIGVPYGAKFEVKGRQLVQIRASKDFSEDSSHQEEGEEEEEEEDCGRDNRGIVDDASSQKLMHHEIQLMKEKGCSGQARGRSACGKRRGEGGGGVMVDGLRCTDKQATQNITSCR